MPFAFYWSSSRNCGEETLFESTYVPSWKMTQSERPPLLLSPASVFVLFRPHAFCVNKVHCNFNKRAKRASGEYLKKPLTRHAGLFSRRPLITFFKPHHIKKVLCGEKRLWHRKCPITWLRCAMPITFQQVQKIPFLFIYRSGSADDDDVCPPRHCRACRMRPVSNKWTPVIYHKFTVRPSHFPLVCALRQRSLL